MNSKRKTFACALAGAALLLCTAQAQAQTYYFSQKFDIDGFLGTVSGSFAGNDTGRPSNPALPDGIFQQAEMTFLTLNFDGVAPVVGNVNLSFAVASITSEPLTRWFPGDKTLGDGFNGFFLTGLSSTGTQMTWVAGPAFGYAYGNDPAAPFAPLDPENSNALVCGPLGGELCRFGEIALYDSFGAPISGAQALSNDYVTTAVPEPSTYLMLLGGIAAVALKVRRRAA